MRRFDVYILASTARALYPGVTNDLVRRLAEHRDLSTPKHTSRYRITRLVYCEEFTGIRQAIEAEKRIKGWRREKKLALIEESNPTWKDLSLEIED